MVAVIVEVADLERSAALYRDGFGIDLHDGDNGVDDRWTGGKHAEVSWADGAYLHFALYAAKDAPTSGVQLSFAVDDVALAAQVAEGQGARLVHAPRVEAWGTSARLMDFDGNVIELTQRPR
jgi:predicted enzyme related to lactoylglutathione lyase